jgi:hypothetical protein
MTTGRINQVTVRPSRRSAKAWQRYWSASRRPLPSPEFVTSRIEFNVSRTAQSLSVVIQRTRPRDAVNLVPRSHTPQVAFPWFSEPKSAPSVETANANGRPAKWAAKRNAADLLRISCNQVALAIGKQSTSLSHRPRTARRSTVAGLTLALRAQALLRTKPKSLPKRVHPARQAHRPPGPGKASHHSHKVPPNVDGAESKAAKPISMRQPPKTPNAFRRVAHSTALSHH